MNLLLIQLVTIYLKLGIGIGGGWALGKITPEAIAGQIGKWLFWVGVPISVFGFVRQIELTGSVGLAPVVAWLAMGLSLGLAWLWLRFSAHGLLKPSQGSFLLASTVGNTGYLGFPISLAIAGQEAFAWALFYDLLGSLLWGYGIGVMIAAYYGQTDQHSPPYQKMFTQVAINPALWSLVLGLICRAIAFPPLVEKSLAAIAWGVIMLAIVLIGMRLSRLKISQKIQHIRSSLLIKMLIVPLFFSLLLTLWNAPKLISLALILQIGMPPAFATLIVSETYELDQELAVSALAAGTCLLLATLPIWVILFH
ncbi:MAG: AEC family transporter [Limnothrix sp. RL_2_0]|nr:AEC family transporter [Limnothrix sp. RL_2_0]